MPKITIEGRTQGGQAPMFGKPYQEATYQNVNFDRARGQQRREADYENADFNRSEKRYDRMQQESWRNQWQEAQNINVTFSAQQANLRKEAEFINTDHRLREATIRRQADYDNMDHRLRETNLRREAEYVNSEHRARETNIRQEAGYINRELDAQRKAEDQRYRKDRAEAEWINANMETAARAQRREADILNAAMGGGGRGGAGGGGRGYVPFAGGMGFGNTAAFGAAAFTGGMSGYLAMKAVEELIFAPQAIGSLEAGALSASSPYINLKRGAYATGRAGGFSGDNMFREFFPGSYKTPEWMRAEGLGPQEAMERMNSFGIAPVSSQQGQDLARAAGSFQFMPGLSGMNVDPIMQTMAKYGMMPGQTGQNNALTGDVASQAGSQLSVIMENAVSRGLNRAEVLRSIDAAVSVTAHAGSLGANVGNLSDFMFRFTDMPGGRTGEAGLQAMAGLEGANASVGSNPMRTVMYGSAAMRKYGSEKGLTSLLGGDFYKQYSSTPTGQAMLKNYYAAVKSGDMFMASQLLKEITVGNPEAQQTLLSQSEFMQGVPGYARDVVTGNMTGTGTTAATSYRVGPQGAATGPVPDFGSNMQLSGSYAMGANGPGGFMESYNLTSFNKDQVGEYRAALLRQGVNPAYIDKVIEESQKRGIDPRLAGAIMHAESRGGNDPNLSYGKNGQIGAYGLTGIQNPFQISGSSKMPKPTSPGMSIEEGLEHIQEDLKGSGGSMRELLKKYSGSDDDKYYQNVVRNLRQGGVQGGVPGDVYSTPADAQQGIMAASASSFAEMNELLPRFNAALGGTIQAIKDFGDAVHKVSRQMDTGSQYSVPPP